MKVKALLDEIDESIIFGNLEYVVLAIYGHGDFRVKSLNGLPVKDIKGKIRLYYNRLNKTYPDAIFGEAYPKEINIALAQFKQAGKDRPVANGWYSIEWLRELVKGNNPIFKVSS